MESGVSPVSARSTGNTTEINVKNQILQFLAALRLARAPFSAERYLLFYYSSCQAIFLLHTSLDGHLCLLDVDWWEEAMHGRIHDKPWGKNVKRLWWARPQSCQVPYAIATKRWYWQHQFDMAVMQKKPDETPTQLTAYMNELRTH
jgi:hypothetical protein